jgi:predicted amidophosphoribosyltransferase
LRRRRATRPQSSLDGEDRRDNVRGAFVISGLTPARRRDWQRRIAGKALVLVDDVMTTGATLEEAAATLRAAGARDVRAVTLARVEVRDR